MLADNPNTLRELVNLVKKKQTNKQTNKKKGGEGRSQGLSPFRETVDATHVNLCIVTEPRDDASDRSGQLNTRK